MNRISPCVAIVDGRLALRRYLAEVLERAGYAYLGLDDCASVVALPERERPDVIVLDERAIRVEPESVRALILRSNDALKRVPVIAVSSQPQPCSDLAEQGFRLVIGKPVVDKELVAAVRSVLNLPALPGGPATRGRPREVERAYSNRALTSRREYRSSARPESGHQRESGADGDPEGYGDEAARRRGAEELAREHQGEPGRSRRA